jgi:putative sterol carrier protein
MTEIRYLSDEWLAALDRAAKTLTSDPDRPVVIEQTVRDGEHEIVWHTTVSQTVRVVPGPAVDAAIRFSSDRETALAITSGRLSAQRAFLDGRLHLRGDVGALMAARPSLAALADGFAAVRADTSDLA